MKKAKRVAMLGFDCAEPHLIEQHIKEGALPNFERFIKNGFWTRSTYSPLPTITPPNWATLATGAWPGTHGVTDFWRHTPGTDPVSANSVQSWNSQMFDAETIWQAASRGGKRSIIFNYPGAWPNTTENAIVVGSRGFTIGEFQRDGLPHLSMAFDLSSDFIVSTGYGPSTTHVQLDYCDGWEGLDEAAGAGEDPQECSFSLPFLVSAQKPEPVKWWVLVRDMGCKGYDTISLSPTRNLKDAFCTLKVGQWSKKIVTTLKMSDGTSARVMFRVKNLELSDDAGDMRLLVGAMVNMDQQWTAPAEYGKHLFTGEHVMHTNAGMILYSTGIIDGETWLEMAEEHTAFNTETVLQLLRNEPWDLFYMHSHPIDWMYHQVMTGMMSKDKKEADYSWDLHRRTYQIEDRLLGVLMDELGEDTLIGLVSDHGAVADGFNFNPTEILEKAGLVKIKKKFDMGKKREDYDDNDISKDDLVNKFTRGTINLDEIDMSVSRAVAQRTCHVYVNLKGRDPNGIVEPEDYKKVQEEICDALLTYRDPVSGMRPVRMALPNREGRFIGLHGPKAGDVIYAIKPEFGGQHGAQLPTEEWLPGKMSCMMAFKGPGIKKNATWEAPSFLVSLVPTLCYLSDLPVPSRAEGPVLYPAMEDPDFYKK